VSAGVQSAPGWIDDDTLIYTKLADNPDLRGYQYSDIYEYSISGEQEIQLTHAARAFAPAYIPAENSVAFISMKNGLQNIYSVNKSSNKISRLTNFLDGRIIHSLNYDPKDHQLIFDYTLNHFRNVATFRLHELRTVDLFKDNQVDEREAIRLPEGSWIYSSDKDGIFNLILQNDTISTYITRTNGGAFMPDINQHGQIAYSLYSEGRYHIAVIDSIRSIDNESVGYKQVRVKPKSTFIHDHIDAEVSDIEKVDYADNFSPLFFAPRVFIDYGTIKPGFYFQSAEILGRTSIFGSAAANSMGDLDLALNFSYSRLFPTLYAEVYFSTRNIDEKVQYSVFEIDENIRYRFLQISGGVLIPVMGKHILNIFGNWERYRAFVKETIPGVIQTGIAYDYFRGIKAGIIWSWNELGNTYDRQINPSKGYKLNTSFIFEKNRFITGLALSNVGTLTEEFSDNDLIRVSMQGEYYWEIPNTNRWTISIRINGGWMSNKNADSFFHFFSGGYPGIRGYPYYSIGGASMLNSTATFTLPIIRDKDFAISTVSLQNSTLGIMIQYGDAWTKKLEPKLSAGIQLRIGGFSFYHVPLAIGFEVHRGLSIFSTTIEDQTFTYGNENRIYFTMLFGF
ncbi:MAG: BamA/TamA family outer membrane protein, partial [Candidatus Neomarinimicrobiota bacterium]